MSTSEPDKLLFRVSKIQLSSLCDADKSLEPLPPTLLPMVDAKVMVGPAFCITVDDDHLATYQAVVLAPPGSVIVIATKGGQKAIVGGLFSNEARRRGLRGFVVDGYMRDIRDITKVGLPIWARGAHPAAGGMKVPYDGKEECVVFGQKVRNGDIVVADEDGVLIASRERIENAIAKTEEIERKEATLVRGVEQGIPFAQLTNVDEYLDKLKTENPIAFQFYG